jgi:hypothetical protein
MGAERRLTGCVALPLNAYLEWAVPTLQFVLGLTGQPLRFIRADRMDDWIYPVLRSLGHLDL